MDGFKPLHQQAYPLSLSAISLLFSAGVIIAIFVPMLPGFLLTSVLALLALLLLLLPLWCICGQRPSAIAGWLLTGFAWAFAYSNAVMTQWLSVEQEGEELAISGYLLDFPRAAERGWQFDFYAVDLGGKIRLSVQEEQGWQEPPRFDCHYRFIAKLRQPRGLVNLGQYDYQAWLLQAGYRATGYVRRMQACEPRQPGIFLRWRSTVADWITAVDISERASSTLLGLLIGSYADIDVRQWQVLRDSGTIHLLSVSGLHIVMVAALMHTIVSVLARMLVLPLRWWPAGHWGAVAALLFATLYALLAGFSVATQRSLIMVAVAVLQRFLYGRFRFAVTLEVSLLLVLFCNPLSVLSAGFWFSFLATGLLLLANHGYRMPAQRSLLVLAWAALRLQWLLFLLMAPVLFYVYGRVPLLSLPLNLLAVPWVSFVTLPTGFAALMCLPFFPVCSDKLLHLSGWTLDVYWNVMQAAVDIGQAWQWSLGGTGLLALVLALVGLYLMAMAPPGLPMRWLGVLLCLPMLFPRDIRLAAGEAEVTTLDVGQGLAVIVRTAGHTLVYDTGDRRSERFDAGRDLLAPALRNLRVRDVDMLIVSHADSDHAGGAVGLLQELPVHQLWSGTPELLSGELPPFLPCRDGMHWRWDGVDFRVLHPGGSTYAKENNRSCVLQVGTADKRLLLTGDIEQLAEQTLLHNRENLRADVLLAPHHGSKTSSSSAFLSAVKPAAVIVSAGYRNRFHHPAQPVIRRYEDRDIHWLNTAEVGAIRLKLSATGIVQQQALCESAVFWRAERRQQHCGK